MEKYIILVNEVSGYQTPCVVTNIKIDLQYKHGFTTWIESDLNKAMIFDNESALKMVKKDFGKNYKVTKVNI